MSNDLSYEIKDDAIINFRGRDYGFLSNLYAYKIEINYKGYKFYSVEAAYHGAKHGTEENLVKFADIRRGDLAKKMSMTKKFKRDIRPDWDDVKEEIMRELVWAKFSQNEKLKERLLATGDRQIVEGNDWGDTYWGVCNGVGLNRLGEILMEVREKLRNSENN